MNYIDILVKTLTDFEKLFITRVPFIIIAFLSLFITYFTAKLAAYLLGKSLRRVWVRANLVIILEKLTIVLIWFLGILIAISIVFPSVTTGNILATLGLSSIALGFAFKDIIENFLAGILILLREPFHIGDYIETKDGEVRGTVEHVSVRNTHIRRNDGVRIVVPNALLFSNAIRVMTDLIHTRQKTICCIDYSDDLEQVRKLIERTVSKCKTVSKDKEIQVYVSELTSSGINLEIYWWCGSKYSEIRRSRDELLSNIKKALDREHIKISHSYTVDFFNRTDDEKKESEE